MSNPTERSIVELLREAAIESTQINRSDLQRTLYWQAADTITTLRTALAYAQSGFSLAYNAAEKHHNDEVLLHCGHHETRIAKLFSSELK